MTPFGIVLARQRRRRGWSQQELAERAALSQKHISFLETGRSAPGKTALNRLLSTLARDGYEADALLAAAGLRNQTAPKDWADPAMAPVRAIVQRHLEHSQPWPAYALQPDGSVLARNRAIDKLLSVAEPHTDFWARSRPAGPNIFDLTLHPDGISRFILNPIELVPAVIQRLRRAAHNHPAASATLQRISRYPLVREFGVVRLSGDVQPMISERYQLGPDQLAFTAMATHFGSIESEAMAGIAIETLVPNDTVTEALLNSLAL